MKVFLLFIIVFVAGFAMARDNVTPRKLTAYKLTTNITLDGKLDESVWLLPSVDDFTQRDPNEGQPASEITNVWIAYDEENIYVAAKLFDSRPDEIDASLARRDSWIDSDWFYFYVDPYHDKSTGYFFGVNAGGSIMDGTYYNDSWNDDSWDGIWEAESEMNSEGWGVEIKIPISQLRFNQKEEITWGVNFCRQIKRLNERSYYVMVPKNESGFVSRFATLDGLNEIKPKQRFEVTPYLVQKAQYLDHDSKDPFYKGNQYKTTVGADLKIGLGSNLNIDATINPDFGQVEVDPAVVNLSAYETYFPEKRPFFIEGQDLFYFGYGNGGANNNWGFNFGWPEIFYSRRIGRSPHLGIDDYDYIDNASVTRIIGAAKLTGKIGNDWSVGGISAVTERMYTTYDYEGVRASIESEPASHYGVLRAKKEFNSGNQALGFMFTSVNRNLRNDELKEILSKDAFTAGMDGWTYLDKEKLYVLTGAFATSYTHGSKEYLKNLQQVSRRYYQRPDASYATLDTNRTSLEGFYSRIMLNKQSGNFYVNAALGAVSPGFEYNDIGFQSFANRLNGHLVLGYRWFEPDSIFRFKNFHVAHSQSYDFEGNNTSNFVWGRMGAEFLNYWGFEVYTNYNFPTISNSLTRGGVLTRTKPSFFAGLYGYSDNRKKIILNFGSEHWTNNVGGFGNYFYLTADWKPNSQVIFSFGPSFYRNISRAQFIDNIEDDHAVATLGTRSVFGEINQKTISANIRLNWTFSPELSLQLFLQPLFSVGSYSNLKEIAKPKTLDFNYYDQTAEVVYNKEDEEYEIDPDKDGPAESFTISDPNFNFKSIRGNIVLRWEIQPGSIFYLVWSHERTNSDHPGEFSFGRDFSNLMNSEADNIFMAKFSYWLDM